MLICWGKVRGLLVLAVHEFTAAVHASSVSTESQRSLGLMEASVTSGVVHCAVCQAGAADVDEVALAAEAPAAIAPAMTETAASVLMEDVDEGAVET